MESSRRSLSLLFPRPRTIRRLQPSTPSLLPVRPASGRGDHDNRRVLPPARLLVRLRRHGGHVEDCRGGGRRRMPGPLRHSGHSARRAAAVLRAQTHERTKVRPRLVTQSQYGDKRFPPDSGGVEFERMLSVCTSDGPICRICHEGGSSEGLLSPCDCTGTLGTVHKSCLEKWLSSSNTSYCELCHTEFSIERRPKPLAEVTVVCVRLLFLVSFAGLARVFILALFLPPLRLCQT